ALARAMGEFVPEPPVALLFFPQDVAENYVKEAGIPLVLRPRNFLANAQDVARLHAFVTRQAPRYHLIKAPTIIITGDRDTIVSPELHSRALAAVLPNSKLIVLKGVGHMPHHVQKDMIYDAILKVGKLPAQ